MTKRKKPRTKGQKLTAKQLQKAILKLLKQNPKTKLSAREIARTLKISNNKDSVNHALQMLSEKGLLRFDKVQKFRANTNIERKKGFVKQKVVFEGRVDLTRSGAAYIICEDLEDDVFVAAKDLKSALSGDLVKIELKPRRGRRQEGRVMKVLERSLEQFIGTLRRFRKYSIVLVESLKIPLEVFVDHADSMDAQDGDAVVVKVTKWPSRSEQSPSGRVTAVLGAPGSNDIEMKSILLNNGFDIEFSEEILAEAEKLSDEVTPEDIRSRRDMRKVTTFTIDPDTAKDFDDALSIEFLENGDCEVGVHIADVTHYLKEGTALDKEAFARSTSVYLVDRVAPMLPERLSNELCSLRPNEDKFTFSAVFVMSPQGEVKERWFGRTLTYSDHRFAYEEAQEVLETGEGPMAKELKQLNAYAKKLRKDNFKYGAIAFETEEVKFKLDEQGRPLEVVVKERKDAHLLIENFMLLANREVATFIVNKAKAQQEIPFVYRVHDLPNPEKVAEFVGFARMMGFQLKTDTPKQIAASYNRLAREARDNEALRMLEPIAIRTMAKAIYTTENIGHYGLGFENYAHFTSPIRRYSDVLTHRILFDNLEGIKRVNKDQLEEKCKHISNQERKAMSAERESIKLKQVEYMQQFEGQELEGYVSGIIDRGFFVELIGSKAEGMVGFETMGEAYEVAESRLVATGLRSRRVIRMGDKVKVVVLDTDISRRQINLELAE